MPRTATGTLTQARDGVPGFIAAPERWARVQALLIVHCRYGVAGHIP